MCSLSWQLFILIICRVWLWLEKLVVIIYKNGPPSDDLDIDIYCQGHDPEQHSEDFSRRSLLVKKLLREFY